jgi:hypothetical protein
LHAAVPQRAVVERKAWALTTKPADSEKRLPVISVPATLSLPDLRVEIDLRSEAMSGAGAGRLKVSARAYLIFGDIEGKLDVLRVECTKHPAVKRGAEEDWGERSAGDECGTGGRRPESAHDLRPEE